MTIKLTLSIDKNVVEDAKAYSAKEGTSVSRLVENYLKLITQNNNYRKSTKKKEELPPILKRMRGVAKTNDKRDYKEIYREEIIKKYYK